MLRIQWSGVEDGGQGPWATWAEFCSCFFRAAGSLGLRGREASLSHGLPGPEAPGLGFTALGESHLYELKKKIMLSF